MKFSVQSIMGAMQKRRSTGFILFSYFGPDPASRKPNRLGRAVRGRILSSFCRGKRFARREKFAGRCRSATSSFVVPMRRQRGPAQTRRQTMRVMVLAKATEGMALGEPTPEALEAFAAMD